MRQRAVFNHFGTVAFLLLINLASLGKGVQAQTILIKLVNGRNGRPMAGTCVNAWVGNERKEAMAIRADNNGVASVRLTENDR
jgi:hypothetical protein